MNNDEQSSKGLKVLIGLNERFGDKIDQKCLLIIVSVRITHG
jgi:hypothetical protein